MYMYMCAVCAYGLNRCCTFYCEVVAGILVFCRPVIPNCALVDSSLPTGNCESVLIGDRMYST